MNHRLAWNAFCEKYPECQWLENEADEYGEYGVRFMNSKTNGQAFFVYKWAPGHKGLVSTHLSLFKDAQESKMPIVMGVGKKPLFYMFRPEDIDREAKTLPKGGVNERENGTLMINFPITIGTPLQKRIPKKEKATPPEKNKELPDDGLFNTPMGKILKREFPDLERVG